jgi:hypothetical protein
MCIENTKEDFWHLFCAAPFSDACWTYLGIQWDTSLDFQLMVRKTKIWFGYLQRDFHPGVLVIVIGMTLSLMLDLSLFPSGELILLGG